MAVQFSVDSKQGTNQILEDGHSALTPYAKALQPKTFAFLGLYDGYINTPCVRYVKEHLPAEIEKKEELLKQGNVKQALEEAFVSVDETFCAEAEKAADRSGATAVIAIIELQSPTRKLHIANVGDIFAVLSKGGKPEVLTVNHAGENPDEEQRIINVGGQVYDGKVMGCVPVARAFGSQKYKDLIIPDPFVREHVIQQDDEFVVMATGPFWADYSEAEAVTKVSQLLQKHQYNLKLVCKELVDEVSAKHTEDSVTVAVILLNPNAQALAITDNTTVGSAGDNKPATAKPQAAPATPGGSGGASGHECPKCKGKGERKKILGIMGHLAPCKKCGGSGKSSN